MSSEPNPEAIRQIIDQALDDLVISSTLSDIEDAAVAALRKAFPDRDPQAFEAIGVEGINRGFLLVVFIDGFDAPFEFDRR